MNLKLIASCAFFLLVFSTFSYSGNDPVIFCGSKTNDLYILLKKEGYTIQHHDSVSLAVSSAHKGAAVFVVSDAYPKASYQNIITQKILRIASRKKLKLFVEYPVSFPGLKITAAPLVTTLERGVIPSDVFGLEPMTLLGIHNAHILPVDISNPLIVLAKVVGYDKAEYGLADTKTYPLLFEKDNVMVAMTKLSNFAIGRYGPSVSVKNVWTYILSWMTGNKGLKINNWPSTVSPMFTEKETLPENARLHSIRKGTEWFDKGKFFVHPDWKYFWLKHKVQGDGTAPFLPAISEDMPNGDGTLGILEGHASNIRYDGTQLYRYWLRADVQGETGMALAASGKLLNNKTYTEKAERLIDFVFRNSNLRGGEKDDPNSDVFGLIGWATTFPGVFYGDDNARFILGALGTSAYIGTDKWDKELAEAIMANFRTTGKYGFSGERIEEKNILEKGWRHYWERDLFHPSPHFESWMWACYLWLYNKSGYEPLLTKTKHAIRMTMEVYPDKWEWGSSFQTQRARMILPLAWLVRIEDTEEHRNWLHLVATDLLKNQVESGAIREEIGSGPGRFKHLDSNDDYGTDEGSLIFQNGDPVSCMLYTNNFALFSLNEAAHATGNKTYKIAADKLSDFLTRIQVNSPKHKDLDGAWFRAFDYDRWDYWASNSDWGWGAWCTLTGWMQSWIIATQIQLEQNQNFWNITSESSINDHMNETVQILFGTTQTK